MRLRLSSIYIGFRCALHLLLGNSASVTITVCCPWIHMTLHLSRFSRKMTVAVFSEINLWHDTRVKLWSQIESEVCRAALRVCIAANHNGTGAVMLWMQKRGICCRPIERWTQRNQSVYMHIIAFHHTLQAVWIRPANAASFSLHHAKSHSIDYPSPCPGNGSCISCTL